MVSPFHAALLSALVLSLAASPRSATAEPLRRVAATEIAAPAARDVVALLAAGRAAQEPGDSVEPIVQALRDLAATEPRRADEAAAALLLLDRNDDASDVLLAAGRASAAFEVLLGSLRLEEAFALPAEGADSSTRSRALARLGLRDDAGAELATRLTLDVAAQPAAVRRAVREAGRLGLEDHALTGALALVAGAPAARAREMLGDVWPARCAEAEAAWTWLASRGGVASAEEMLVRIREMLDVSVRSEDAESLLSEGPSLLASASGCAQERLGAGLVALSGARRGADAALGMARAWAAASQAASAWTTLGDRLARSRAWANAADAYGRAAVLQPGDSAVRWLQAASLREAGDAAGAAPLFRAAKSAASSACDRVRLAGAMDRAGDHEEAASLLESLVHDAAPGSSVAAAATSSLARRAGAGIRLPLLRDAFAAARGRAASGPLTVATVLPIVRDAQAGELSLLAAEGDVDGALALSRHALDPFLSNLDATADVVASLKAAERADEADDLLAAVSGRLDEALAVRPDAARLLNSRAWLAARTRTALPEALVAAERATRLAPRSAGILDTLAEVRFQSGDRAGALEAGRRALALEPGREYLARQVERFASGDPATPPPVGLD